MSTFSSTSVTSSFYFTRSVTALSLLVLLVFSSAASAFIVSTAGKLRSVPTPAIAVPLCHTYSTPKYPYSSSSRSSSSIMAVDSFQDGTIQVSRPSSSTTAEAKTAEAATTSHHSIHYRIHNRMNLSSQKAAPILVLHGGPGVPSDYLYPLADVVPYRSIVYYDQLGCGRSQGQDKDQGQDQVENEERSSGNDDKSNNKNGDGLSLGLDSYSIESSLDDLEILIKKIGLRRFHLYGQSFGGILAFEYMKRIAERNSKDDEYCKCLSAIISSSPTNVTQVEGAANDIIQTLLEEDDDTSTLSERFRRQNQCRTVDKPQALIDAYAHAGTVWRGTDVIQDYVAERPSDGAARMPSALVMRGEYDFVTEECVQGWREAFNHKFVRMKILDGCSHHGLLEDGKMYGEIVDSFFAEYD